MLGVIPVSAVLAMNTPDTDPTGEAWTVGDILDHKRRSPHYPALLEEIRTNGMELPIIIRTHLPTGELWIADGQHRVAAAVDLGIDTLIWSDLPLEVEDCRYRPMMDGRWGPYRPASITPA